MSQHAPELAQGQFFMMLLFGVEEVGGFDFENYKEVNNLKDADKPSSLPALCRVPECEPFPHKAPEYKDYKDEH